MSFHISVICADPTVEAMLAAALEPSAIAASSILYAHADLAAMISKVSYLSSPAEVSPRSDLAIVYDDVWDTRARTVELLLPLFSAIRIMCLRPRGEYGSRQRPVPNSGLSWRKIDWLIIPFDNEEFYLRIYKMLKTPRAWIAG